MRKNITQPADWWKAFRAAADKRGLTLSEWMGKHCRQAVKKFDGVTLSERVQPGRPKGGGQ